MENVFEKVKGFFKGITDLMFAFLTVGILVQVLFGGPVFGMDVVGNVVALIESLGNSGFVGLLSRSGISQLAEQEVSFLKHIRILLKAH